MKIDANVTGIQELLTRFKGTDRRFRTHLQRASNRAGLYLQAEVKKGFALQNWAPISPKWIRWKAEHGLDTRILLASHILFHSIKHKRTVFTPSRIEGEVTVAPGYYPPIFPSDSRQDPLRRGIYRRKHVSRKTRLSKKRAKSPKRTSIAEVAAIHEYGMGLPARPIFASAMQREPERKMTRIYLDAFRSALGFA